MTTETSEWIVKFVIASALVLYVGSRLIRSALAAIAEVFGCPCVIGGSG